MRRTASILFASAIALGVGGSVFFSYPAASNAFGGSEPASTCGDGLDCSSDTFTGTNATDTNFSCTSAVETCFDPGPGANNGIGTDGSGRLILGTGAGTATICMGQDLNVCITENGNVTVTNGALILNTGTGIYNQTAGKAVPMDAAFGVNIAAKTLGTCALAHEGDLVRDAAAGGTSGAQTRVCLCVSDGGGTPAYTWVNTGCPNTAGTSTTCPACP